MGVGHLVVIGASAGGVRALQVLAAQLDPGFAAPLLVVQHVGSHPSMLPALLARSGPLPAAHAQDGVRLEPGRIYVAPPDRHMVVDGDLIRVNHGPREHHTRPAVDPLFRSAAVSFGPAAVGVVLTGFLDDGTAGLQAIKRCGGRAVVQDPDDAEAPSMPLSALRYVEVDHCVPLSTMGALLASLVAADPPARIARVPELIEREHAILLGKGEPMAHTTAIGSPSVFACPDCYGTLFQIDGEPPRFRCHTGHAFSLRSLHHAQAEATDEALWSALRALQEKQMLLSRQAESHAHALDAAEAAQLEADAALAQRHVQTLRSLIESLTPRAE